MYSIRDRLIEYWNDTNFSFDKVNPKQIYYLSIEYLLGRALQNAVLALDVETEFTVALKELGFELEELYEEELDPGLGNGGLGRLAACYLDSMATQNYPCNKQDFFFSLIKKISKTNKQNIKVGDMV